MRQRNQRCTDAIFLCCVKSLCFIEAALRFLRSPQQHQCSASISLCPRLFGAHSMFSKYWYHSLVDCECLRREVEFEISISDVLFRQDRLNSQAKRGVALARAFEKIQCSIVTTLQKCKESNTAFNSGESYRLSRCFCLL